MALDDVTTGGEHSCEETSPVTKGDNTPTMDFDHWTEDPFALGKETDVFSSFTGDVEEVVKSNSDTKLESFPPSSDNTTSNDNKKEKSHCRKRHQSERSWQKEEDSSAGAAVDLKSTISSKKKSDYIPISRRKKKPKGMPKRPLSAYNLYFQAERTKIIANQEEGNGPRIGFEGLGKIIGKQWRDLSSADKIHYEKLAEKDSERYRKEMDTYHEMKAKRFAEEDRRAAEQSPVLSSLASSNNTVQASFMKQQGSLQVVPIGEAFGNSISISHPPESMASAIPSLPPGTASISYRPIQIDYPPSPPPHTLQHNNILEAPTSRSAVGTSQGYSPSPYFPQATGARRSELSPYEAIPLGQGAGIRAPRDNNCPMPPGMEVVLSDRNGVDRKYIVQYTCYSMTRENANKYIESLTGGNSNANSPRPRPRPPPPAVPNGEYGEWSV